jgi:hypothetical protein
MREALREILELINLPGTNGCRFSPTLKALPIPQISTIDDA